MGTAGHCGYFHFKFDMPPCISKVHRAAHRRISWLKGATLKETGPMRLFTMMCVVIKLCYTSRCRGVQGPAPILERGARGGL